MVIARVADQAGAPHHARGAGTVTQGHRSRARGSDTGDPRGALLAAIVSEVAERGYKRTTMVGICSRAGVTPTVFREHFASTETCFLAACRAFADELISRVARALDGSVDWEDGVRTGLGVFLEYLAEHPEAARACMVEGLAAGPEALAIRDVGMRAFAHFVDAFQHRAPDIVEANVLFSEATVGGIYGIVIRRIRDGETSTLPQLLSSLAYFLLAPIVGCPRARLELPAAAAG